MINHLALNTPYFGILLSVIPFFLATILFEKTNQLDLFYKIKERYLNLQSLLTTLTTKVDSDNILKLTNNAIINDNALLDDETALIKDMFNNNKIEYKFENNEFELK